MHKRGRRGETCCYCGRWAVNGTTCAEHVDLLLFDPHAYLRVSSRPMPSGTQLEAASSREGKATR